MFFRRFGPRRSFYEKSSGGQNFNVENFNSKLFLNHLTDPLHTWYDGRTTGLTFNDQFSQKWVKTQRTGPISEAISPTDFILGTKVQPNKTYSMTQVLMTLTFSQGQIFPKIGKKTKNWSYLGGYFTYRLHTW